MKKEGLRLILILGILFIAGGFAALFEGVSVMGKGIGLGFYSIFQEWKHLPTSFFDVIASGAAGNFSLTSIVWIDTLLINIATLIPSVLVFLIGFIGLKEIPSTITGVISLIVFIAVLELFSSIVFWIILGVMIIVGVILSILNRIKSLKNEALIVKEAKLNNNEEIILNKEKEEMIVKTDMFYTLFELWKKNGSRPFKAFNPINETYVYISTNPTSQYNKYGKVYGRLSYTENTYIDGRNCEIYYSAKRIWKLV